MEIIIAVFIAIGAYHWGASSSETEATVAAIETIENSSSDQPSEYVRKDGYYIKDLTVRAVSPEGCNRPVLTTDLSAPSQDGVRNVTEVETSCEG